MGKASNASKTAWNSKHYVQIKFYSSPELAVSFKKLCMADGVSMSEVFKEIMQERCNMPKKVVCKPTPPADSNRGLSRKHLTNIIDELGNMLLEENSYLESIDYRFYNKIEATKEIISKLEQAISCIEELDIY
jgi:hypothetical protein